MNPFTLPSQHSIDPDTGEVINLPSQPDHLSKPVLNRYLATYREPRFVLKLVFIVANVLVILTYVFAV